MMKLDFAPCPSALQPGRRDLTGWRWWRLNRRLDRSWRRALAERDDRLLGLIRSRIATPLVAVAWTGGGSTATGASAGGAAAAGTAGGAVSRAGGISRAGAIDSGGGISRGAGIVVAELTFLDGFRLRLGPCHGPAVAALAAALGAGRTVRLGRATRHRRFWALDFTGPEPVSLLAGTASEPGGGAPSDPGRRSVPGRGGDAANGPLRRPAAVA